MRNFLNILAVALLLPAHAWAANYALQLSAACSASYADGFGGQQIVTEPIGYVYNVTPWDGATAYSPIDPCGNALTKTLQVNSAPALGSGGVTFTQTAVEIASAAAQATANAALVNLNSGLFATTASLPSTCGTAFGPATLNGSIGSTSPCVPRANSAATTVVQRARATLASGGTFTVTWANSTLFTSGSPVVQITPIAAVGTDIHCVINTTTNTGATGSCVTTAATINVLALGLITVNSASAAGTVVQLTAADPSQ